MLVNFKKNYFQIGEKNANRKSNYQEYVNTKKALFIYIKKKKNEKQKWSIKSSL